MCCRRAKKNRGQKSICGHKKGGQYSMSHWKIGVKILCVVLKRGSKFYVAKAGRVKILWKLKYGGQNSIFFSWNPWSKFYVPWKGGSKFYIFFPVPWKRGVKTAEPTNQLHWRGAVSMVRILFWFNQIHVNKPHCTAIWPESTQYCMPDLALWHIMAHLWRKCSIL